MWTRLIGPRVLARSLALVRTLCVRAVPNNISMPSGDPRRVPPSFMVASSGPSFASGSPAHLNALHSTALVTERPGYLQKYLRNSPATIRTWQAKLHAKLSTENLFYLITHKGCPEYDVFRTQLGTEKVPMPDEPDTRLRYDQLKAQWAADNVRLYDLLVQWPGVGEDSEMAALILPRGQPLRIS